MLYHNNILIGVLILGKTLVLIDFENLYMGPLEPYSLALTSEGIKKLIDVFKSSNEIANGCICWFGKALRCR